MGARQRVTQPNRAPKGHSWNNLNKLSNTVLDYNPKYKIKVLNHTDINE